MDPATATQLITAGSTLAGVVLTLLTTAFLERRRARDTRELETLHLQSERAKWLREARQEAYAGLSMAGEEVLQFFRSELPAVIEASAPQRYDEVEARWRDLRTELRKAYNRVALFGAEEARTTGQEIWRAARNGGNDFFRSVHANGAIAPDRQERSEEIRTITSQLGTVGDRFLEACRNDLQDEHVSTLA
jgi:hypothetical protein